MSPSIDSIYNEIVSLASKNQIEIKENQDNYSMILSINLKNTLSIELIIPTDMNHQPIMNQLFIQDINTRFDKVEEIINKRMSLFEDILTKLNTGIDEQNKVLKTFEAKFENQLKLLSHKLDSKLQQTSICKSINNCNIGRFQYEIAYQPKVNNSSNGFSFNSQRYNWFSYSRRNNDASKLLIKG